MILRLYARQHGWIGKPEFYEYKAAQYIVPGRLQVEFVRKFFGYGEEVIARPDLNLTHVTNEWLSQSDEDREKISEEKRCSLGIKAKYVILVLTTMARKHILNEFDYPVFEDCWLKILAYLKHHPELHVIIKGHPKPTSNYKCVVISHDSPAGSAKYFRVKRAIGRSGGLGAIR